MPFTCLDYVFRFFLADVCENRQIQMIERAKCAKFTADHWEETFQRVWLLVFWLIKLISSEQSAVVAIVTISLLAPH